MREVQASEAKTHLSQLLDDVERGETLIITRHGHPIARLTPEKYNRRLEVEKAIAEIAARRRFAPSISVEEIIAARDEGRKF
jgi:prevent-host-death family protein